MAILLLPMVIMYEYVRFYIYKSDRIAYNKIVVVR